MRKGWLWRHRRVCIWLVTALVLVGFVPWQIDVNDAAVELAVHEGEWQERVDGRHRADLAARDIVKGMAQFAASNKFPIELRKRFDLSFDCMRELLSGAGPLEMQADGRACFTYRPTFSERGTFNEGRLISGGHAWLIFESGRYMGIDESAFTALPDRPGSSGLDMVLTISRRLIYLTGYVATVVLFIIWVRRGPEYPRPRRRTESYDILGIALMSAILVSLGPDYFEAWRHFLSVDAGAWSIIFVPVGALAMLAAWIFPRPIDPMLCRNCRYNLTGNVSGRCPECGRDIPKASEVQASVA